jgi:photosystem II stability/assembly factor-like uncharacterized protein
MSALASPRLQVRVLLVPILFSILVTFDFTGASPGAALAAPPDEVTVLASRYQTAAGPVTDTLTAAGQRTYSCPPGFYPAKDLDQDCVDDDLERNGFRFNKQTGQFEPCTPSIYDRTCFVTDPTAWSTDGDPYSDFQKATGVNMDGNIQHPYNHPLVAAAPRIEVRLVGYRFTPKATITDAHGREMSVGSTQEFSASSTLGVSITTGVEVSGGATGFGVSASVEATVSYSRTLGYSTSQTRGESVNWETATTTEVHNAASLALDIVARNAGSAIAQGVRPTFNLFIGDEPIGTIVPDIAFQKNLGPGVLSDPIIVDRRVKGNTNEEITLTWHQLRQLQLGAPVHIQVIGLEAGISRWRADDSAWACGTKGAPTCDWEPFEDQIKARTIRLIVDFGYSGDPNAVVPPRYVGSPFEYRIYTGSPGFNPHYTLRDLLNFIGYDVQPHGDKALIEGRVYPDEWFVTAGPEKAGTNRDSTLFDYWVKAGRPDNILDMEMPRGVSLLLASPDPIDPGPVVRGALIAESMRGVGVVATPKGSIPVDAGEAHLYSISGEKHIVPLVRIGSSSYFTTPEMLFPIAAGRSYVVMRDILGSERTVTGLTPLIPVVSQCAEFPAGYIPSQGSRIATVFIGGDPDKPATVTCTGNPPVTHFWYRTDRPPNGSIDHFFDTAEILDSKRWVAVERGYQLFRFLFSEDGGKSWTAAETDIPLEGRPEAVSIAFRGGRQTGLAVGYHYGPPDYDFRPFIWRTEDGGLKWKAVDLPSIRGSGEFMDVDFAGGDTWYLAADDVLLRSVDDGRTWEVVSFQALDRNGHAILPLSAERPITHVSFASESIGAIIIDPIMLITLDGGATFHERARGSMGQIGYDLHYLFDGDDAWYFRDVDYDSRTDRFLNVIRRVGALTPDDDFARGDIVTTSDYIGHIAFSSPGIGYAVSHGGKVFRTDDTARTWTLLYEVPRAQFASGIRMQDANRGFVWVDAQLYHTDSGGGFPTVSTGVGIDREPGPVEVPRAIQLAQNYPNPFNPLTTITYEIAQPGVARLEVFDLLGRRVAVLVDGFQHAGAHEVRFEANDLPSGMYVYRLRAGSESASGRMILMK